MSWQDQLLRTLHSLRNPDRSLRVVIVGIGHELRGDDAVGLAVARLLCPYAGPHLMVIEAGAAPENYTGRVRRFGPDLVVLVDAVEMEALPGTIQWLDWRDTESIGASTHTLPLAIFAGYLASELACPVALIGIQPGDICLRSSLTNNVQEAAIAVVHGLSRCMQATDRVESSDIRRMAWSR